MKLKKIHRRALISNIHRQQNTLRIQEVIIANNLDNIEMIDYAQIEIFILKKSIKAAEKALINNFA